VVPVLALGLLEGDLVGLGVLVGELVGLLVGVPVALELGATILDVLGVGLLVGLGVLVGLDVGLLVGLRVGLAATTLDVLGVGLLVGLGVLVGLAEAAGPAVTRLLKPGPMGWPGLVDVVYSCSRTATSECNQARHQSEIRDRAGERT
jgi:hypothetical protein